jgi:hypothetical protein
MCVFRNDTARRVVRLAALVLAAGCAESQAPRIAELNRQALEAYDAGELGRARALLVRAIKTARKEGLDEGPTAARTYLNLGAVDVATNDRGEALRDFGIALSLAPDIEPGADIANPTLKRTLAVARLQLKRGRGAAAAAVADRNSHGQGKGRDEAAEEEPREAPAVREGKESTVAAKVNRKRVAAEDQEPDLPANVSQPLYCPAPDEAPPAAEIPLRCVSGPGVSVSSVVLYYRPAGSESFTPVPMVRSRKGWYEGVVPASALVGKTLQYYVEALGPGKQVATSNGQPDSPNLVIIRPGAAPVGLGPLAAVQRVRRESGPEVEDDPLVRSESERQQKVHETLVNRRRPSSFWAGLGIGSGIGWHPQRQLEFRYKDAVAAGISPAGLMQLSPEVGWQVNGDWAVSLQTRHQFIPESGSGDDQLGNPAHGAFAVLVRGYRYFGDRNGQPFVSAALGVGQGFRLVVPPHPEAGIRRNDTVRGGPLLIGPGAGYLYNFNSHFGWAAEARLLAGIPDKAALVEILTGAQLGF